MITVRRPSGLVVEFTPPEVTVEAAIERSWEIRPYGLLLEPKRPTYALTYPDLGYQRRFYYPALSEWPDSVYDWGHAAIVPTY